MGIFDSLTNQLEGQLQRKLGQSVKVPSSLRGFLDGRIPLGDNGLDNSNSGAIDSGFSIDEFRSHLSYHGEVAKSDKFDVLIMIPQAIAGKTSPRELALQCEASELPGRDINMIEYRHYGFIKRIPHQNQYGQANFTFYCAGDMHEKKLFDRWLDIMVPTNSGLVSYPVDSSGFPQYECDLFVNQYSTSGIPVYQVKLIDAIPTNISPLTQNWSDDSVHRLTVTFAFRKWVSGSTNANIPATDISGISNSLTPIDSGQQSTADGVNNYTNVNNVSQIDQRAVSSVKTSLSAQVDKLV